MKPIIFNFEEIDNSLYVLNFNQELNFSSKRLYFLDLKKNSPARGFHAHKNLSQIFILIKGSFNLKISNFKGEKEFLLNETKKAFYLPKGYWREIYPMEDTLIQVIASDDYCSLDYIRDKSEFMKWSEENKSTYE